MGEGRWEMGDGRWERQGAGSKMPDARSLKLEATPNPATIPVVWGLLAHQSRPQRRASMLG